MKSQQIIKKSLSKFLNKNEINYMNYKLVFSKRFKSYNGNIEYNSKSKLLKIKLSDKFKKVGNPIKIGIIRILFRKIVKKIKFLENAKKRINENFNKLTNEEEIYYNFIKRVGEYNKKEVKNIDKELKESFKRVNHDYFKDKMDMPNIKWSKRLKTTLGYYEYSTDTITLNTVLKGNNKRNYLDFIMYHELLHKKHKFNNGLRKNAHTPSFKNDERKFKNYNKIKKELKTLI